MVEPRPGGRPATYSRRRIVDANPCLNRTGCSWRQLPHDFPPWETVCWYFKIWNEDGVTDRIHDALRAAVRDAAGRDPMASAGIVDAQSVKGADTVGAAVRGLRRGQEGQWPLSRARNAASVPCMTDVGNRGLSVVEGLPSAVHYEAAEGSMRMQRVVMPETEFDSWTVLGDDQLPVERVSGVSGLDRDVAQHDQGLCPPAEGLVHLPRCSPA